MHQVASSLKGGIWVWNSITPLYSMLRTKPSKHFYKYFSVALKSETPWRGNLHCVSSYLSPWWECQFYTEILVYVCRIIHALKKAQVLSHLPHSVWKYFHVQNIFSWLWIFYRRKLIPSRIKNLTLDFVALFPPKCAIVCAC